MLISSYLTSRDSIKMGYPIKESIKSLLNFSDEVIVFDTSETTHTVDELTKVFKLNKKVKIVHQPWDWTVRNCGVLDGQSKAAARSICKGDLVWQNDSDEIVHEEHSLLIKQLGRSYNWNNYSLIGLPVVEFWGSSGKTRIDVNPWKWRFSINDKNITHGIPGRFRTYDKNGLLFAKHGTDGCDYIYSDSLVPVPCDCSVMHLTEQVMNLRQAAITNEKAAHLYEGWFNIMLADTPGVFHYSWWNIERKIKHYREFWTKFWPSLYNESTDETQNPFFPGLNWSEVTDQQIKQTAKNLEQGTGGWVFHQPWDGSKLCSIKQINMNHPEVIKEWLTTINA
jgi:hypothetical protein